MLEFIWPTEGDAAPILEVTPDQYARLSDLNYDCWTLGGYDDGTWLDGVAAILGRRITGRYRIKVKEGD